MTLPPPLTTQPHYGEHLGDVGYWSPYVREVLDLAGIGPVEIEAPFVGTFPTFLAGDVVIKLFGDTFDGADCFTTEQAALDLLTSVPDVPTPELIKSGQLFDEPGRWSWPYLIMERLPGRPIREFTTISDRQAIAELGAAVARLHALPIPEPIAGRDLVPKLRVDAVRRLRGFGLPDHLLEQVPDFLADAPDVRIFTHADLTADHVFLDHRDLVGIIDWADAIPADPWYELVALRFDALRSDPELFSIMLDGYGWPRTEDFPIRALQGVLEFQFNAITTISELVDLERIGTLIELADRLYGSLPSAKS